MEETRTRFCDAMPASRSASSKDVKRSLCFPTPFVRKRRLGTMSLPNSEILLKAYRKNKTNRNFAWCGKEIHNWINLLLSGSGMRQLLYGFPVYGDLHKRSSGPAESLVFSMNQGQIAAHRRINKAERYQRPCSNLVRDVGSSDESYSHARRGKTFKEFAGVEFHGEVRLQSSFFKNVIDSVPCSPQLR